MIVSALLTSVGINLALCIFFFVLYSIFRTQPRHVKVYAPRLVAEAKARGDSSFNVDDFLRSTGWLRRAWDTSEDDLLASSGLDAVVFMRIFIFSSRAFSVATIIGLCVLVPVNYFGGQLKDIDFSDLSNKSLDLFSISNVKDGSARLWVHFSAAYVITGVVCYLLYIEFKYISSKRLAQYNASKPEPHHFTILVRGIPTHEGSSLSDIVESFFMENHPSTYLSHVVIRQTDKLRGLIADAERLYRQLTHLKSRTNSPQRTRRGGFLGLFGQKVDLVSHYSKKLEDLEANVRIEQSDASSTRVEVPAAFVCFRSRYGAASALCIQQSINPTQWVTEEAPEPRDVHWPCFSTSFIQMWFFKLAAIVATFILTVIFLVPVAFVQSLNYLQQFGTIFPFLKGILQITVISQVITGFLPGFILQLFLSFVPPMMKLFSTMQSYISQSEIERSSCSKMLWFTIWNTFFANVVVGSASSQLQFFFDPKYIPSRLAVLVPAQASFFISYVVTSWTGLAVELTRMISLVGTCLGKRRAKPIDQEVHAPSIPYDSEIPRVLLFGLLGLTYFMLAPLILPFIVVFFFLGYIIYRNQLLNVCVPKYDTGGRFWPIVHNASIFSLILMQALAFGIFGLKKLPLASSLILPLPVLTLLFNEYCRKRFLPVFHAYSAETLMKRDREDQKDPSMDGFLGKVVSAYRDPALIPINRNGDERNSPLLYSAEA